MEYVVLDLDRSFLIGKVDGHIDGCNLASLSLSEDSSVSVQPIDTCDTLGDCFTQYSLGLLLKNITGSDHSKFTYNQLAVILIKVLQKCDKLDYDSSELLSQVQYKEHKGIKEGLQYVKGSRVPAKFQDGLICVRCDPLNQVETIAEHWLVERKAMDDQADEVGKKVVQRVETVANNVSTESKQRSPVATKSPRNGSTKETIWSVADKVWESQGKPTDVKLVLSIRKEVMTLLENDYGVKKTSSSNELGKWQKERLN